MIKLIFIDIAAHYSEGTMLEAVRSKISAADKNSVFKVIHNYLLSPIKSGLGGFAGFFSILIATKFLGYVIGTQPVFEITMDDVLLSLIGFLLIFLIRLLENIRIDRD